MQLPRNPASSRSAINAHWLVSRRTVIAMIGIVVVVAGMLAFSPDRFSKRVRGALNRQWLILTGRFVDVGGYRLRVDCWGSGDATVVFDGGLNQPRASWGVVPDEVAKFARVCTYDRAGVGESEQGNYLRTSADAVRELRTLLERKGEESPFVLVGHSFGGLNVRLFASTHPDEIAGLVLVDPSHEDQYQRIAATLPADEAEEYMKHEGGDNGERMNILESAVMLRSVAAPASVPVILLSAEGRGSGGELSGQVVNELHENMITSYVCGSHFSVANTGHFIQLDRPDAVIESVSQILNRRNGRCNAPGRVSSLHDSH